MTNDQLQHELMEIKGMLAELLARDAENRPMDTVPVVSRMSTRKQKMFADRIAKDNRLAGK